MWPAVAARYTRRIMGAANRVIAHVCARLFGAGPAFAPRRRRAFAVCSGAVLAVLTTGATFLAVAGPSHADAAAPKNSAADTSLADINRRLVALSSAIADHGSQSASEAVRLLAAKRNALLAPLFTSSPAEAQQFVLPADARGRLRGVAGDLMEKAITVRGTYTELSATAPDSSSGSVREVSTPTGVYRLTSAGSFPPAVSGSQVEASGDALGSTVLVEATGGTANAFTVTNASTAGSGMTGPTPVAVILATFSDTTTPPTVAAEQTAFSGHPDGNDVDSWYAQASYGTTSVNPSFFGPFALNETAAPGCADTNALAETIINAAAPAVTYANFTRLMFIVACTNIGGLATVGTTSVATPQGAITAGETWIGPGGWASLHTLVHELGHNAGMSHADWVICQPDVFDPPTRFGPNCVAAPYGDPFDVMGQPSGSASHPDAYHTALAGWFSTANDPVVTAAGTASYTLAPIETPSAGPMALTIPRGNTGTSWTIEYRHPVGADSWMSTCGLATGCNVTGGASIKINGAFPGSAEDTHAVDMTPASQPMSSTYWPTQDLEVDGALLPGHSFTDPEFGFVITVTSADASGLGVQVTIPAQTCTRAAPTVTLPSSAYALGPVATLTTVATVTDNDSAGCPPQRFDYTGSGFADPGRVTLAPGGVAVMSVTYTPPSLGYGYYSLAATVVPDSLASPPAGPTAQVVVSGPADTAAPSTPLYLTAQARGSATVSLHWATSSDAVGVAGYRVYRDGTLLTKVPSNVYLDTAAAGASHTYAVTAINEAAVESPQSLPAAVAMPAVTDTTAPAPPSGVSATSVTDHGVTLRWDPGSDNVAVAYYEVVGAPTGALIIDPVSTTVTINGLQSSTPLSLYVLVFDGAGNQSPFWPSYEAGVQAATATSGTAAPASPAPVLITAYGSTHASLSWSSVNDAAGVTGYTVFRNSLRLATVVGTTYTDNGLNGCGNCQYSVQANDAAGNVSAPVLSDAVYGGTTDAPAVSITSLSPGATISAATPVTVSAGALAGITSVAVYLDGHLLGTATSSPYAVMLDPQWARSGSHTVLAIAKDASNNLAASAPVNVTTSAPDTTAPAPPAVIEAFPASPTEVDIQWSVAIDNVAVASYEVMRDGTLAATVTTPAFSDASVTAGSTHSYAVVAADAAGNLSPTTPAVTVTTMNPATGTTPSPSPSSTPSPTSTPTATPVTTGAISGVVMNAHNAPVASCSITVSGNGQTYATTTGTDGTFALSGLVATTYTVTAKTKSSLVSAKVAVNAGTTSIMTIVIKH